MTAMYPSTGSRSNHAFISTAYPECPRVARSVVRSVGRPAHLGFTGNFASTLPCGIAAATGKQRTYGSIYTTKLLRRGEEARDLRITRGRIGSRASTTRRMSSPCRSPWSGFAARRRR